MNYLIIKIFAPHYIILILLNTFFLIILPLILEKKEEYPPEIKQIYKLVSQNNIKEFESLINSKSIHEQEDLNYFGGHSLINYAITYNSVLIIQYLLDKGFDVNLRARNGETPLFRAINANKIDALKILLKYKPDLTKENDMVI